MRSFIALTLISSISFAQVQHLDKGQAAPFEGYIFSLEAERANRKSLLDLDVYKALDESNKRMLELRVQENQILTQQYNLWKTQSESLSKQLVESNNNSFWKSLLYFSLGALVTTGIAFGVTRATR